MKKIIYSILIITVFLNSCTTEPINKDLSGEYLGQVLPGDSAVLFAPGIVSTGAGERDIAISPDGKEIYFCREIGNFSFTTILYTRQVNGVWTKPEVLEICNNPEYLYFEPHLSPDGNKLFFVSNMPKDTAKTGNEDIWVADRTENGWAKPYNLGAPINTDSREYFPTLTVDGTMYYNHVDPETGGEFIYRSKLIDGVYQEPEKIDELNIGRARFNATIARDESYIILPVFGLNDTYGATDYYILFRSENDTWSEPINLGPMVNSADPREWSAAISPDGKYFFFMSARKKEDRSLYGTLTKDNLYEIYNSPQNGNSDIYWIKADFINVLKQKAIFNE